MRNVRCMCCRYMIREKGWCEWYYWLVISYRREVDSKLLWFWSICIFIFTYINKADNWTHFWMEMYLYLSMFELGLSFPPPYIIWQLMQMECGLLFFIFVEFRIPSSLSVEFYSLLEHIFDVAKWHLPSQLRAWGYHVNVHEPYLHLQELEHLCDTQTVCEFHWLGSFLQDRSFSLGLPFVCMWISNFLCRLWKWQILCGMKPKI